VTYATQRHKLPGKHIIQVAGKHPYACLRQHRDTAPTILPGARLRPVTHYAPML